MNSMRLQIHTRKDAQTLFLLSVDVHSLVQNFKHLTFCLHNRIMCFEFLSGAPKIVPIMFYSIDLSLIFK